MRFAHCLFCEDIRTEVGEKVSLMGVFGGEIRLESPPVDAPGVQSEQPAALLPKLCIVAFASTPYDQPFSKLKFTISTEKRVIQEQEMDQAEISRMHVEAGSIGTADDPVTRFQVGANIVLTPYVVSEDHVLKLVFSTESEELFAGKLRIRLSK